MDTNSSARNSCALVCIRGFVLALIFFAFAAPAQVPKNVSAKGIKNLPYFEGLQLKASFDAETADPLPDGNVATTGFRMLSYGAGGTNDVQFVIKAPKCIFDYEHKRAWSSGPMQVYSITTNYFIEGEGFFCRQTPTNALLEVSNRVHTILRRDTGTNASPAPPIHVFADHFQFTSETTNKIEHRVATYTGNVRAEDPEIGLHSDHLTLVLPEGTNKVNDVVATGNVVIANKADGSHATGERAIYSNQNDRELVILTGSPTWRDAKNESAADTFIFDRRQRMAFAQHHARLKMPRGALVSPNLVGATNNAPAPNQFIEISGEFLDIQLPSTNKTSSVTNQAQNLLVRENVLISSPADKLRATCAEAFFEGATGILKLRTNSVWQTDQLLAKGNFLTLDRSNSTFVAQENSYLRIIETKTATSKTNRAIEIFCDHYELKTNVAYFREHVRSAFHGGDAPSRLVCENMDAFLSSNQVKTIFARQNAVLEQSADGNFETNLLKKLKADSLTINRSPETGALESLLAKTGVELFQAGTKTNAPTRLSAETVDMQFGKTNQLEKLTADGRVEIETGANTGKGEHAIYSLVSGEESFELTGHPTATIERVQDNGERQLMLISNADWLNWNPRTGKAKVRGRYEIKRLPPRQSSTNRTQTGSNIQPVKASQ